VSQAKRNYLQADLTTFIDDQPLVILTPSVQTGYYINEVFTVGAKAYLSQISIDNQQLSNISIRPFVKINLLPVMASATIALGYDKLPNQETALTGKLLLTKGIMKNLSAEASFDYTPYLHTISAINQKLMQWHYRFGVVWNDAEGFAGKAGLDQFEFPSEENGYFAASAWVLSPKVKYNIFEARFGAGINYSDATSSTFTSVNSIGTITANYTEGSQIQGFYQPFFSPSNQFIAAAIVSVKAKINNQFNLGFDGNFGLLASTDNPYLYLSQDDQNNTIIARGFKKMNYFPATANVFANYQLNNNIGIKLHYTYQSTNYYSSHLAGIQALYKF